MAPVIRRFREERIVWSRRYFMEALKLPDQLYPAHIRMWSEYSWRWYNVSAPSVFFFHVEDVSWCVLCTYLFLCIRLVCTSHLLGVVSSSYIFPLGFIFRKDTDIYLLSKPLCMGSLSSRLAFSPNSELVRPLCCCFHDPWSCWAWWSGRDTLQRTCSESRLHRGLGAGDASRVCDASSKPNDCPPLTYSVGKRAGCVRQQGQWEGLCLCFLKQFSVPHPLLEACRSSDFFFKSVKKNNQLEICQD